MVFSAQKSSQTARMLPLSPGEWEFGPLLMTEGSTRSKENGTAAETTGAMEAGEKRREMKMKNSSG